MRWLMLVGALFSSLSLANCLHGNRVTKGQIIQMANYHGCSKEELLSMEVALERWIKADESQMSYNAPEYIQMNYSLMKSSLALIRTERLLGR